MVNTLRGPRSKQTTRKKADGKRWALTFLYTAFESFFQDFNSLTPDFCSFCIFWNINFVQLFQFLFISEYIAMIPACTFDTVSQNSTNGLKQELRMSILATAATIVLWAAA